MSHSQTTWRSTGPTGAVATLLTALFIAAITPAVAIAQQPDPIAQQPDPIAQQPDPIAQQPDPAPEKRELPFQPGTDWMRLTRDHEVWINQNKKEILVGGRICLREGLLEMFACPKGTKEHEAVVAANTPARYVHAGLLLLGAEPGPPVQFQPTYKPAQGTEIEVTVIWKDVKGEEHRTRAQEWVKHIKTGKALKYPWVFAGSGFWKDEEAGEQFYYADGGEFICVSNFSTAMLDLPVESSDANETLMFGAFSERIPPRETRVYLLLTPKLPKKDTVEPKKPVKPAEESKPSPDTVPSKTTPSKEPQKPEKKDDASVAEPAKGSKTGELVRDALKPTRLQLRS